MTQLRISSWNLLGDSDATGPGDGRLYRQLALLRSLELDALGLQEAKKWDEHGQARLFAAEQAMGMRGFLARSSHACHLALFVREPRIRVARERHDAGPPRTALLRVERHRPPQPRRTKRRHRQLHPLAQPASPTQDQLRPHLTHPLLDQLPHQSCVTSY